MRPRPPAMLGLLGSILVLSVPACDDAKPGPTADAKPKPVAERPMTEAAHQWQISRAVSLGSGGEFAKAIEIAEKILKIMPEDREALRLLGTLAGLAAGDPTRPKLDRAAMLHKAADAFARLKAAAKDPTSAESKSITLAPMIEARALALEGKDDAALAAIVKAIGEGRVNFEELDIDDEFADVRKLPAFAPTLASAIKADVALELANFRSFPFDFSLIDLDANRFELGETKGKVTLVDIWGTWCPPCRLEVPHLVDLYDHYKAKGLEIIGVNCNEEGTPDEVRKKVKDYALAEKITYKCVLNDDTIETRIPDFRAYPTLLFLDRSGKVRLVLVGYVPRIKLEAVASALLDEGGKS